MRQNYSFKTRVILSFVIALAVALLLPCWYYYNSLKEEIVTGARKNAVQQLNLVHWLVSQENEFESAERLQNWAIAVSRQLGSRVTYVAQGGRVVADSLVPFSEVARMDNFASRPEIVQSQSQEIGIIIRPGKTVQEDQIFVAKIVPARGLIPAGVLRLAASFSAASDQLHQLRNSFLVVIFLILLMIGFVTYMLLRELSAPIRRLVDAADAIGQRTYKHRVRFNPGHEFYPLAQSLNQMAERIDSNIEGINTQKQQLEAVFNGMQEGVMVLDSKGKIQSTNRALSRMTPGIPHCIGRRPLEVFMNLDLQDACDRVLASTAAGSEEAGPTNLQVVFGSSSRTYDVNIVRLQDVERGGVGAIVVFHDISELKRLEKVRQDFVANVSHELRTPLTSIKGYTETLLADTSPNPETLTLFLQVISKNTNHMVKMVDDLLQLARLEARHKPFQPVPTNSREALSAAWRACLPAAESKTLRLENRIPETGISVSADFDQFVQVFRNLIENAIRYSPPGETIAVSGKVEGETATFAVLDRGPGIAKQHQQRIFERFYRVEKHRGQESGSTGLGLAICRHIIQNHSGKIWVESPNPGEEKGSTFYFTLRLAAADQAQTSEDPKPAASS